MNRPVFTIQNIPKHLSPFPHKVKPFCELRYKRLGKPTKAELAKLIEHCRIEHAAELTIPRGKEVYFVGGKYKQVKAPDVPKGTPPLSLIALHNHPVDFPPSTDDVAMFLKVPAHKSEFVILPNGTVYEMFKTKETPVVKSVETVRRAKKEIWNENLSTEEGKKWMFSETPAHIQEDVLFKLSQRFKFGIRKGWLRK